VAKGAKRAAIFQPEFRKICALGKVRPEHSAPSSGSGRGRDADPFQDLGKPEPLRYVLAGCWSRRVTQEHRLVYRVTGEAVDFLQARITIDLATLDPTFSPELRLLCGRWSPGA